MIAITLKHYLLDLGLNIFFDRIKENFINITPFDKLSNIKYGDYIKIYFHDGSLSYGVYQEHNHDSILVTLYIPDSDDEGELNRIQLDVISIIVLVDDIDEDFISNKYEFNPDYPIDDTTLVEWLKQAD